MKVNKIIKHRNDTILALEEAVYQNILDRKHYKELFIDKTYKDKKNLLNHYINSTKGDDIFDVAIAMRKIGIVKFYDIMKEELEKADVKNKYLSSCDVDEQNKYIENEQKKLDSFREKFKKSHQIQENYPASIIILFKKIFGTGLIKSQEDIIDYKLDKKTKYLFNRKKHSLNKNILKYYSCYTNFDLFTNGENLYDEYQAFLGFEKEVEIQSEDIQRIKSNIQVAKDEIFIYEKDLEEMKREFNIDAIKRTTVRHFIEYSSNEKMIDYYLEIFENNRNDKELFKSRIIADLRLEFYLEYNKFFEASNEYFIKELNTIKNEFKKVAFASFETTELPLFSNIGYFVNIIKRRIDREKIIINFLSKKESINSYEFSDLQDKVISEIKKQGHVSGFYIEANADVCFNPIELEKYYSENETFINSFK